MTLKGLSPICKGSHKLPKDFNRFQKGILIWPNNDPHVSVQQLHYADVSYLLQL